MDSGWRWCWPGGCSTAGLIIMEGCTRIFLIFLRRVGKLRKIRQKILSVLLTGIFFLSTVISINVPTANAVTPDDLKDITDLISKFQKMSTEQVNDALAIGQRIIVQSDTIPEILNPHQKLLLNNLGLTNAQVISAYNSVMSQLNTEEKINDLKSGDLTKLANFINAVEGSFDPGLKDTLAANGLTVFNIVKTVLDVAKLSFDPFSNIPKADLKEILEGDLGIAAETAARYGLNWGNIEKLRKALTTDEITKLENILNTIRNVSDNANLSGLTVSTGTLDPVFAPDTTKYTVIVGSDVSGFTVIPTTTDAKATVNVNGTTVKSGTASGTISFSGNFRRVKVTVTVTAPSGTEKNYTLVVIKPKEKTAQENDETIDVSADEPVTITIPQGVSGTKIKAKDFEGDTATLPLVQAQAATSLGTVSIRITDDTKITGPAGWDGTITLPKVLENTSVSIDNGNVSAVVEVGQPDAALTFDKAAVRLLLPGQKGKSAASKRGNGDPVAITRTLSADSQALADSELPANGAGKMDVGSDLVIWTKHFTQFIAYTPVGGGPVGGGGGGGGAPATPAVAAISDSDLDAAINAAGEKITIQAASDNKVGFTIAQLDKLALTGKQIEVKATDVTFTLQAGDLKASDLNLTNVSAIQIGAAKLGSDTAKEIADKAINSGLYNVAGDIFSLSALAVMKDNTQQDIKKFNGTVKVTLPVPETARDAASKGDLWVGRFNEEAGAWDIVSGQFDGTIGTFTFETDKFSKWALLTPKLTPKPLVFSDIAGHWAEKQINGWIEKGLAKGYPDGSFKPDFSITRAEFITLVNKSFGFTGSAPVHFTDVSSTDWFFKEVSKAITAGYISGYEDGTLRPDTEISRQEVAIILSKLLKLKTPENKNAVSRFKDLESIPEWSEDPVNAVVANGYMAGYPDQTYQPERAITRAEAIVTLDRAVGVSVKTANGTTTTITNKAVTQSTSSTSQATGGGGSSSGSVASSSDNSAPRITAATITVGDQMRNVEISEGMNGSVDFSGLDRTLLITGGTINVSKASTLKLKVGNSDIPITQKLSSGNNQLEVISMLNQLGSNGMNLATFKQMFGNPVVLKGTLTDGSNNSSAISLTITLP